MSKGDDRVAREEYDKLARELEVRFNSQMKYKLLKSYFSFAKKCFHI